MTSTSVRYLPGFVPGEGPTDTDLMFIGEGPGKEEDHYGRPFVGKSGKELNRYIWHALHRGRSSVYVTNLVKYRVPDDGDPTPADIERDSHLLDEELCAIDPPFVATLGRFSTRYLLGDVDMEAVHGIPHLVGGRVVVPVYHPASGLHSTENQALIAWDMGRLAQVMRGEIEPGAAIDEYPECKYEELICDQVILSGAVDTEGSVRRPWCLSHSRIPGQAIVVRPKGARFSVAATFERRLKLHNSLHDLGVLRAMGIELADGTYDDTMVKAYELGVEPQGLKALAYRHCGMVMNSYQDLTEGRRIGLQTEYLAKVFKWLDSRQQPALAKRSTTAGSKGRTRKGGGRKYARTRPKVSKRR